MISREKRLQQALEAILTTYEECLYRCTIRLEKRPSTRVQHEALEAWLDCLQTATDLVWPAEVGDTEVE